MGGGIGDSILCLPIIRKLQAQFQETFVVFYCDRNLTPILSTLENVKLRFLDTQWWDSELQCVKSAVSDCSLIIWNRFEADNDGKCNYFYANDSRWIDFVREKRDLYSKNLSLELKRPIGDLEEEGHSGLMLELAYDSNYFSDWNRFGLDVGYDDVFMSVPEEIEEKHDRLISSLGKYAIFHDSRLPVLGHTCEHWIKCWYIERWNELVSRVKEDFECEVVQIISGQNPRFEGAVLHPDIIGRTTSFFDYLCLLRHSFLYVGTDSWPAHASVFLPDTSFVILKGASVRRWDHFGKYSSVVRRGNCQGCEYISLDKCVFGRGSRICMESIKVDDVIEEAVQSLKKNLPTKEVERSLVYLQ
jgi:ADP-heptose:LPS heptosyltransferase